MKIGTIDIGTNSMRLLIAEYRDGKLVNRKPGDLPMVRLKWK